MNKKIDLHIHTTMSDGALTPKEVIDEAHKNGVSVISISDHDSIDAYNDELFTYAESKKIKIINAVEISTRANKAGVHVLGYNFDINDKQFKEKLLKNFGHIPNKGEFIETVMNEGCPAYVKKETVTPKEASEMIRAAHGKVVLAHPVAYIYEDNLTDTDILNIIKDMQPDGLEANYLYVDRNNNKINEVEKWNRFANENGLFVTAGSDFHIKDGIRPEIGFVNTSFTLNPNVIDEIIANLTK